MESIGRFGHLTQWLWWLLLVSVPVTSFPLVERTIGGETVSPMSLAPLVLLAAVWLLPHLARGGKIPRAAGPLLLFGLVAIVSSLLAQFFGIDPYKGQTALGRSIRGLSTLAIGIGYFLCASLITQDTKRQRSALRILYLGGFMALLWSAAQAWYILFTRGYIPPALNEVHRFFSVRDLFWDRVTGLAFEPSWFGNQLVILYLPLLLGSIVSGQSAFGRKRAYLLLEWTLAVLSIVMLVLSRSRLSLASFLLMSLALASYGLWRGLGYVLRWARRRTSTDVPFRLQLGVMVIGLVAISIGFGAIARRAIERDPRTGRILSVPGQLASIRREYPYESIYAIANRGAFAERLVYWKAALWPFERYPVTGVGLGNAGFFFEQGVPAYGNRLVEIRSVLDEENPNFPNPKSLWLRLLAETGLVGFASFVVWLGVLATGGLWLARKGVGINRAIGAAGLLALLAQIVEGFSLDTFALPQFWLMMGLLTAAVQRQRHAMQGA